MLSFFTEFYQLLGLKLHFNETFLISLNFFFFKKCFLFKSCFLHLTRRYISVHPPLQMHSLPTVCTAFFAFPIEDRRLGLVLIDEVNGRRKFFGKTWLQSHRFLSSRNACSSLSKPCRVLTILTVINSHGLHLQQLK